MAVPGPAASDELEAMLLGCLSVDNQVRSQAEEAIKAVAKKPEIVMQLVQKISASPSPEVRQLSAVLLRKKITSLWRKLDAQTKETTKSVLLEVIVKEPLPPVRRSTADVVSVVAKHTVPQGEWNHLLEFLYQCSGSQQKEHREVALTLFASLTETIGDMLRPHFATLQGVFLRGLQDKEDSVRVAALKAVGALAELIESDEEAVRFRELLQPIAEVAKYCLAQGEDDVAMRVFEIFSDLVETSSTVLQPQLPALVSFCVEVAVNPEHDLATREAALQIVHQLAEYKPKQLVKHGLAAPLIRALCMMCAEPVPEDWEDTQQLPAQKFASQALDVLSLNLPTKAIFPEAMKYVKEVAASQDPNQRSSAQLVVAVLCEGCAEVMRKHLTDLLGLALAGVKDPHPRVRTDAAYNLGQMSDHLMPDIMDHHEAVMPAALDLLMDPAADVRKSGCYAVDQFVEQMDDDRLVPYMEPLMSRLMNILTASQQASSAAGGDAELETIDMALSAVASAAAAAEEAFLPYAAHVLPILRQFLSLSKDEALGCRARATECAALVLSSLGKDKAQAAGLEEFSTLVMAGMDLEHCELREYAHCFFAHVAKLLKEDFARYLPAVTAKAFESIEQADGIVGEGPQDGSDSRGGGGGLNLDVSSDEEDDAAGAWTHVRTGVLDEKASACEALGTYAAESGMAFMPYIEKAVEAVESMSMFFVEDVRQVAYKAMGGMVKAVALAFPPAGPGQTTPQLTAIADKAMQMWLGAAKEDDSKACVAAAIEMAGEAVKVLGAAPIGAAHLEALASVVQALLKGEAICQTLEEDEQAEEDEEEEESDLEEALLQATCEVMPALATALGPDVYAPTFAQHFESLARHMRGGRPEPLRSVAIGAVAEVAEAMKGQIEPYVSRVMPQVMKELRCAEPGNRRNAAYCAGLLCLNGGQTGARHFMDVLKGLHPLFSDDEDSGTRDNAAGALARILLAAGPAVPLDQAMPVLLGALPLQEDFGEAVAVYGCLAALLTGPHAAALAPFVPGIVEAFGTAALDSDTPDEAKQSIGRAITALNASHADALRPLLEALPPDQQQALSAAAASGQ